MKTAVLKTLKLEAIVITNAMNGLKVCLLPSDSVVFYINIDCMKICTDEHAHEIQCAVECLDADDLCKGSLKFSRSSFFSKLELLIEKFDVTPYFCTKRCPCYEECFDGCPCSFESEWCPGSLVLCR